MLFTFPSRYWFTIGLLLVFSLMSWSTHIPTGYLTRRTLDTTRSAWLFPYRALTFYGWPSQAIRMNQTRIILWSEPHPKVVWAVPLSLAATDGIDVIFLFLGVLRCFNSPRIPPSSKTTQWHGIARAGFPHSEIFGSKLTSSSPKLIAGSHVFRRL